MAGRFGVRTNFHSRIQTQLGSASQWSLPIVEAGPGGLHQAKAHLMLS
jgi:hypothetical protein